MEAPRELPLPAVPSADAEGRNQKLTSTRTIECTIEGPLRQVLSVIVSLSRHAGKRGKRAHPVLAYAARPSATTRAQAVRAALDMDRESSMGPIATLRSSACYSAKRRFAAKHESLRSTSRRGIRPPCVARRLARIPRLPIDLPLPRLALGAAPCYCAECGEPACRRQVPSEASLRTSRSGGSAQKRRKAT